MKKWLLFTISCVICFLSHATPLPANQVFQIKTNHVDANNFVIHWAIKPGYFLYRDRITLKEQPDSNVQIGTVVFPKASIKTNKQGETNRIYRNNLSLNIPVLGVKPGEALVDIHYQGCSDDGFCYPPETRQVKVSIANDLALTMTSLETSAIVEKTTSLPPKDRVALALSDHHWVITILLFFGFGLLLSFTPCMLPMVPVLSGIIIGHGKDISTRKAFLLSLSYVLSMSITYALVGASVALLGHNLQIIMQSPWAISIFSLIFVLLSLSMFGFYELRLPENWQEKLTNITRTQGGGHYLSAAIMGCLSTLILSPCVTAPLIGVLGYIANTGNVVFGIFTLFFLGLGMGTPLLLIGTQAGRWLPSAGHWMVVIKAFFGILLLAVAIYLMSRILPPPLTMGLWAALLIFSGVYCGALTHALSPQEKFYQGLGLILLLYGLLILVGASMGQSNPLQPLAGFRKTTLSEKSIQHNTVYSVAELETAIAQAKGKPVLVDFYADWCASCKFMEATTFQDPILQNALHDFVFIKADITANTEQEKALLRQFNVIAPPTFLFFDAEGQALPALTIVGEVSAQDFLQRLHLPETDV